MGAPAEINALAAVVLVTLLEIKMIAATIAFLRLHTISGVFVGPVDCPSVAISAALGVSARATICT